MAEYIKRDAAIREIEQINPVDYGAMWDYEAHHWAGECLRDCKEAIDSIPTADVAPVVYGLWMPIRESEMTGWDPAVAGRDPIGGYICSACKEEAVYDCNDEFVLSKYCPNCGAKMDGGADHEA